MNRKNKIFILILLMGIIGFCISADELSLIFLNNTDRNICIRSLNSSDSEKFGQIQINAGETKKLTTDFSNDYILNLVIENSFNSKITEVQIFNKLKRNKDFRFYVPGGGPITNWGCAWNNNRIKIKKLDSQIENNWLSTLPFISPNYNAEVSIEVIPELPASNDSTLEFTLMAVSPDNKITEIELETSDQSEEELIKGKLNLEYWDLNAYASLEPVSFKSGNNMMSKWVDLIIHNYTMKSFLFYGIDENPVIDHVEMSYKENFNKDYTVFYPPQSQFRGPSFRFNIKQKEKQFTTQPGNIETNKNNDTYYLIIGKQADLTQGKIDYIPLKITTGSRLGYSLKNGVKINSEEGFAYQVKFIPVNAQFKLQSATPSEVSEKIRIPINQDGKLAFELTPMKNITIKAETTGANSEKIQNNRVAQKYIISGVTKTNKKKYSYRVILIAPPFLAGNTPGKFSSGYNVSSSSDIGNFVRYPLHLYIMSLDSDNKENNIDGASTVTELPENIMGSIEYFISDKDMQITDSNTDNGITN